MRWEELFADLEGQADAAERADLEAEIGDRTRREAARVRIVDRLRGAHSENTTIVIRTRGAEPTRGLVAGVGSDWVLVDTGVREVLVSLRAIESITGLGTRSAAPDSEGPVVARLDLGHALRIIARDRAEVRLVTAGGAALVGVIDKVGSDHLELTEHPPGEARQRGEVRLVPFSAVGSVRLN